MREESAAAEQAIFNDLSSRAAAWEEQAGKTLLLDKAIEYTRTTVVQHTSNEWQKGEYDRYTRSNRVYQMNYTFTRTPVTTGRSSKASLTLILSHGAFIPTARTETGKRRLPDRTERFFPTRRLWKSI